MIMSAFVLAADFSEVESSGYEGYAGVGGGMILPGNGNGLHRAAEASAIVGWYFTEKVAIETTAVWAPNSAGSSVWGVGVRSLAHFSVWEEFDRLFGGERLDPFFTFGAMARFSSHHDFADSSHRTAIGPTAGVGCFYHLTDAWSIRAECNAQLACDSPCGMIYGVLVGLQYSFGSGE